MIREAILIDIAPLVSLASLYLEQHPLRAYAELDPQTVAKTIHAFIENENAGVWVAEHDATVVGFLGAVLYPLFFNVAHVMAVEMGFYVEEAYRACGYGDGLRLRFETWARQKNAAGTLVCAPIGAETLASYYGKAGYEALETQFIKRLT